jgi:hypothetical protein
MSKRIVAVAAWVVALTVTVISIVTTAAEISAIDGVTWQEAGSVVVWGLVPVSFVLIGAFIVSSRPDNIIGWLLVVPPTLDSVATVLAAQIDLTVPRVDVTPQLWLALWLDNFAWVILIFPLLHLLQVFPTGRGLGGRWRWLMRLEVLMLVVFAFVATFVSQIGPLDEGSGDVWTVANPIGFIDPSVLGETFFSVWSACLIILAVGGIASTVARYRRASTGERQQVKWLLFAFAAFGSVYAISAAAEDVLDTALPGLALALSIIGIPIAMALAVVRNRLFDIDVIIRRTIVYAVLTGLLAALYAGSVFLLRGVLGDQFGAGSSLSVAASTLLIAGLFSPLRKVIQGLIDRRLFRQRYDSRKVVEDFAMSVRDRTEFDSLPDDLLTVVGTALQPESGAVWIRNGPTGARNHLADRN